jgi:hypothetical protein
MQPSERPRARPGFGRLVAGALVPGGAFVVSCVSLVSLEHRSCPCAEGYVCCERMQTCLRPGEACVGETGGNGGNVGTGGNGGTSAGRGGNSATGGNAGTELGGAAGTRGGSSSQGGATSGAGGVAGESGMGGEPGPEWRPVGPERMDDPQPLDVPDLELAWDGTPYLAFVACEDCDISGFRRVPVVERFDGSWRLLPTTGLPATIVARPALALDTGGVPYVLIDGQASSFDGTAWNPVGDALPLPMGFESNFQVDEGGVLWVALFDDARAEISVFRSAGSGWQAVGPGVPAVPADAERRVRLVPVDEVQFDGSGNGGSYLAHTDADGTGVFLRRFDGVDWVGSEMAGSSIDIARVWTGTLYAAVRQPNDDVDVLVQAVGGDFVELGNLTASCAAPSLAVASDGTLFLAYSKGGFVNVNRWDGMNFRDVDSSALGSTGTAPVLRLLSDFDVVPFVALFFGSELAVKKYE